MWTYNSCRMITCSVGNTVSEIMKRIMDNENDNHNNNGEGPDFEPKSLVQFPPLPPLAGLICNTVIPHFNCSPILVNCQLLSLPPVGILNKFMLDLQRLCFFSSRTIYRLVSSILVSFHQFILSSHLSSCLILSIYPLLSPCTIYRLVSSHLSSSHFINLFYRPIYPLVSSYRSILSSRLVPSIVSSRLIYPRLISSIYSIVPSILLSHLIDLSSSLALPHLSSRLVSSIHLSTYLSAYPSIHPSIHLIYLSVCLTIVYKGKTVTFTSSSLLFDSILFLMNSICCSTDILSTFGRGFVVSMTNVSSLSASVTQRQYIIFAVNMHSDRMRPYPFLWSPITCKTKKTLVRMRSGPPQGAEIKKKQLRGREGGGNC